jgi:hypothetical protein
MSKKFFAGKGLGTHDATRPICAKFPPDIDAILRSLPDRSEKIRQWVIEGMQREKLLDTPDS